MDVVYTVKDVPIDEELTYSVRSLENLPHDKLVFVGGCPNNFNRSGLVHILVRQASKIKYKNTTLNLLKVAQDPRVSDDFIWMNDDFFVLKPVQDPVQALNLTRGTIQFIIDRAMRHAGRLNNYLMKLKEAGEFMSKELNIKDPLSFELHTPMIFNKAKVLEMFSLPKVQESAAIDVAKRSLYGNLYMPSAMRTTDVKVMAGTPISIEELQNRIFLSTSDKGWVRVREYIQGRFTQKSPYEV